MTDTESNSFSLKRSQHFIRQFLMTNRRMLTIGFLFMLAVTLVFGTLVIVEISSFGAGTFMGTMIALPTQIFTFLGAGLSSILFSGTHKAGSTTQFLSLPVSAAERLIAGILISLVGYTVIMYGLLFTYVYAVNLELPANVVYRPSDDFWAYLIVQCIFIYGAVYFRKNQFISTFVVLLIVGLSWTFLLLGLNSFGIINPGEFTSVLFWSWNTSEGAVISNVLLCLLFLSLAYFRLKNHEAA